MRFSNPLKMPMVIELLVRMTSLLDLFSLFWGIFKSDIIGLFQKFFSEVEFDHRFSKSFIPLIPKVKGSSSLNDFRPIFFLGWIHKLFAKVLTSRLCSVIDQLISHIQIAFIHERSIYDGWVVASELPDVMKRNKEGLIFKLNFEKSYDCVDWSFLLFILRKMGFGDHWISWIRRCISVAHVSVLVNGSPGPLFHMQRGFHQECPLSPLLFNLVGESLNILVNQFQEKGWLEEVSIPRITKKLSILQYADDTILILRGTNDVSNKI